MRYLYSFLLFMLPFGFYALGGPVKGTILDAKTNEPIAGVSVSVTNAPTGGFSDERGEFFLDLSDISSGDTILFTHFAYDTLKLKTEELQKQSVVYMQPKTVALQEVRLFSGPQLSAEEIIEAVSENFSENHSAPSHRRRLYFHKLENVPFPDKNKIVLKKSDFAGMDKETFNALFQKIPDKFTESEAAIFDLYSIGEHHRLVPVKAFALEEGAVESLNKDLENSLSTFFKEIEKSADEKDTYYKVRTGILSVKAGPEVLNDSIWNLNKNDTLNKWVLTGIIKYEILNLLKDYTSVEGENLDFITKSKNYNYELKDIKVFNNETAYEVLFTPGKKGLFEGRLYISTSNFAVLLMDFAYAEGKQSDNFRIFGFGHSMNFKSGRIVFGKSDKGYYPEYIQVKQHESSSVERSFAVIKKKKRFLFDKKLNEIKFEAELFFDVKTDWEILVLDRDHIDTGQFKAAKEPEVVRYRKSKAGSPQKWIENTGLSPANKLGEYRKIFQD